MGATDWNWFFSAFAQSTAAIVGVATAFVVSKIVGLSQAYESNRQAARLLLVRSEALKKRALATPFDEFCGLQNQVALAKFKRLLVEDGSPNFNEVWGSCGFSVFVPKSISFEIMNLARNEFVEQSEADKYSIETSYLTNAISEMQKTENEIRGRRDEIREYRKEISDLLRAVFEHVDNLTELHSTLAGSYRGLGSLSFILLVSAFLFFVGVIYPLHFMPIGLGASPRVTLSPSEFSYHLLSIRGGLLVAVSALFAATVGTFLYIVRRLGRPHEEFLKIGATQDLAVYSEHFRNAQSEGVDDLPSFLCKLKIGKE